MHLQKVIVFQCSWRRRVAQRDFGKLKLDSREKDSLQFESIQKVEKIDWIGVDNFLCVLPCLVDLVNNLKIGIIWSSCLEKFKFENQARLLIFSKYLIRWHCRIKMQRKLIFLYLTNLRSSSSQWRRIMQNKNAHYYLLILLFYNFIISYFLF